jgi:hypothetical protein
MIAVARLAPGSVVFEPWEVARMIRVQIADRLHKLPHEIDAAPRLDIEDCLAMWSAEEKGIAK